MRRFHQAHVCASLEVEKILATNSILNCTQLTPTCLLIPGCGFAYNYLRRLWTRGVGDASVMTAEAGS
jgi:hypothetical protein